MLRYYSYVHIENDLKKHLFDNDQYTLYVWTTLKDTIKTVQFEIVNHSIVELSADGYKYSHISDGDYKNKPNINNIFNRAFTKPIYEYELLEKAIQRIDSNYARDSVSQIKKMLLERTFKPLIFEF